MFRERKNHCVLFGFVLWFILNRALKPKSFASFLISFSYLEVLCLCYYFCDTSGLFFWTMGDLSGEG